MAINIWLFIRLLTVCGAFYCPACCCSINVSYCRLLCVFTTLCEFMRIWPVVAAFIVAAVLWKNLMQSWQVCTILIIYIVYFLSLRLQRKEKEKRMYWEYWPTATGQFCGVVYRAIFVAFWGVRTRKNWIFVQLWPWWWCQGADMVPTGCSWCRWCRGGGIGAI